MAEIKKVLANHSQTLTSAEQKTARDNIDASKVVLGQGASQASTEAVAGTSHTATTEITVNQKSLVLCTVYASITGLQSASDLTLLVEAPGALKIGKSEGDGSLSNSSANYTESGTTGLHTFTSFYAVLNANSTLQLNVTFGSSVSGFDASYSVNYCEVGAK